MPEPDHPAILFRLGKSRGAARLDAGERRGLRRLAERMHREVTSGRPFTCLLTGDDELRRMNRDFLGHDYATDVLSFPLASPGGGIGDIAISLDRAAEQAAERGHAVDAEIGVLMLHGVLHLLGMDHERDRGRMRRVESKWRAALGLPESLIERTRRSNASGRRKQ
jgi:probable rRNA maturation factor